MSVNPKGILNAALLLAAFTITIPSYAAVIEEVVVTAQKREQNVQEVGIAVSRKIPRDYAFWRRPERFHPLCKTT